MYGEAVAGPMVQTILVRRWWYLAPGIGSYK
jgi:hypothetical protein